MADKVADFIYTGRAKISVNGKKAKRKAVKTGMTCIFNYPGAGEDAKNIDCKS